MIKKITPLEIESIIYKLVRDKSLNDNDINYRTRESAPSIPKIYL